MNFQNLMCCHIDNKVNFSALVRLINQNVVVPFLGAGFSANFGYPVWGEFLEEQAKNNKLEDVKDSLKENKLECAANQLEDYLGDSMEYVLVQNFGSHIYKETSGSSELELIPQLFRNLILTTNFDEVIEMLYAKVHGEYIGKLTPQSLKDIELSYNRIANGDPTLIKLHGDVATREFVLTEQQYNKVYGKALDMRLPLPAFLRDILITRTILFIGCSLEYDRTLRVIEQAQMTGSKAFAFLELPLDAQEEKEQFLRNHNIFPIWFPHEQYGYLKIFLRELSNQVNITQSITMARNTLSSNINMGTEFEKRDEITHALCTYKNAEETLKKYANLLPKREQLDALRKIEAFYTKYGYIFESKEIIKKILLLTRNVYGENSLELAKCFHNISYAYEKYYYYDLFLRAMLKSYDIMKNREDKGRLTDDIANFFAYLYIGLGYSYLKKTDIDRAKVWYQKAEKLLDDYSDTLPAAAQAFIHNGLFRYYMISDDSEKAIDTLDCALKLRIGLHSDKATTPAVNPQHIVNSFSNKIRVYLKAEKFNDALKTYEDFKNQSVELSRNTRRRIKTDYGDILRGSGRFNEAYSEYREALSCRKYLHFSDDFVIADIYINIAECLKNLDRSDEALEYLIHSCLIYANRLGGDASKVHEIWRLILELGEKCSYSPDILRKRMDAQNNLLKDRYGEKVDGWEQELIAEFGLK